MDSSRLEREALTIATNEKEGDLTFDALEAQLASADNKRVETPRDYRVDVPKIVAAETIPEAQVIVPHNLVEASPQVKTAGKKGFGWDPNGNNPQIPTHSYLVNPPKSNIEPTPAQLSRADGLSLVENNVSKPTDGRVSEGYSVTKGGDGQRFVGDRIVDTNKTRFAKFIDTILGSK